LAITESLRNELLKLTLAERIRLAMDLWDSIEPEETPPPATEQMQEAERRYEELVRNPEQGSTWEEVKAQLMARYGNEDPTGNRREPT
jgi:putative addiction module component (TIGR02574 family)